MISSALASSLYSADTDGKSGLSKKELTSAIADCNKDQKNFFKMLLDNFDRFDEDKNGQLGINEISYAIECDKIEHMSSKELSDFISSDKTDDKQGKPSDDKVTDSLKKSSSTQQESHEIFSPSSDGVLDETLITANTFR